MEADRTGGEILEAHWAASIAKLMSPRRRAMKEGTDPSACIHSMKMYTHTHTCTHIPYTYIYTQNKDTWCICARCGELCIPVILTRERNSTQEDQEFKPTLSYT